MSTKFPEPLWAAQGSGVGVRGRAPLCIPLLQIQPLWGVGQGLPRGTAPCQAASLPPVSLPVTLLLPRVKSRGFHSPQRDSPGTDYN